VNWHWTTLNRVLQATTTPVLIADHLIYRQVTAQPNGVILKAVKSGLHFPRKRLRSVRAGQFIVSRLHASRGAFGVVPPELDEGVVTGDYLIFSISPDINPDYFAAYLTTSAFRRACQQASGPKGRLYIQQFRDIPVPIPTPGDQRHIADLWHATKEAQQHTLDMLSQMIAIRQGVASDWFRNVNPSWERTRLGDCATIGAPYRENLVYVLPPCEIVFNSDDAPEGGIGLAATPELDSYYLFYYLEFQKPALKTALSVPGTRAETVLSSMPFALPTLYEQRKIVGVLQQADEAVTRLRAESRALRRLTQGVLNAIFTGSIRVQEAKHLVG
jgi:restriction endonuclease S subunit